MLSLPLSRSRGEANTNDRDRGEDLRLLQGGGGQRGRTTVQQECRRANDGLRRPLNAHSFVSKAAHDVRRCQRRPGPLPKAQYERYTNERDEFAQRSLRKFRVREGQANVLCPLPRHGKSKVRPGLHLQGPQRNIREFYRRSTQLTTSCPKGGTFERSEPREQRANVNAPCWVWNVLRQQGQRTPGQELRTRPSGYE